MWKEVAFMNNINLEDLYKVIEDIKKQIKEELEQKFQDKVQQLEQKNVQLEQKIESLEQEVQTLKKRIEIVTNEYTQNNLQNMIFQNKLTVIGIQNNWYMKSSEEYQSFDTERIQELNKKYHINGNQFKNQVLRLEKKTKTERLEILQNYFHKNPNNKLSISAVMELLNVSWHTAKLDMFQLVELEKENYEICKNTVIRNHKNHRKQTQKVLSIQKKGSSL